MLLLLSWSLLACVPHAVEGDKAEGDDTASSDPSDTGKDADCADTFGAALTADFGRVDGTLLAVVEPGNSRCADPNSDHVVVQVLMEGEAYRMVVNVQSDSEPPEIRIRTIDAPLPAPAFDEGWHTDLALDYPTDFGVHSTDDEWAALPLAEASATVADALTIGAPISVYATSSGGDYADSTHLIHRQGDLDDGALVIDPTGSPRWMLFSFADQVF
jgi:hypothetical protein